MQSGRDIKGLLEIMAALRTPVTGCPWDLEQDFSSIAPYAIEEAHEVADAIARDDTDDIKDELGDLLLQVVFHAQMAKEADLFDFGDVVAGISEKMIRRHPHVFGDGDADSPDAVKKTWEEIKAEERANKPNNAPQSRLDKVPASFPPMLRAVKLQKAAAKIGFDWDNPVSVLDKIDEESAEIRKEITENGSKDAIKGEIGDLLFAIANLCRHLDISPEQAAIEANAKFSRRFKHVEHQYDAITGQGAPAPDLAQLDLFWEEAKASEHL